MALEIKDRVYGLQRIEEPVLAEIMETPAMQRLKGVNQFGMPDRFYKLPGFTRYEHSLGVMLILRRLGADIEEQASGLIHDISHPTFSHLIDWVIGNREREDHQDRNLQRIVSQSEIPKILSKHGLDPGRITEIESHSLLEKPSPLLCADRFDYAIREFQMWAVPSIVDGCLEGLTDYQGQMAFKGKRQAVMFANGYAKLQREHWAAEEYMVRWELLAMALKTALKEGIIREEDFYSQDEEVIAKLAGSGNPGITNALRTLEEEPYLNLRGNRENPQFSLKKKFRHIDPHYLEDGKIFLLSESDPGYKEFLERQRQINERGIKVDLVE